MIPISSPGLSRGLSGNSDQQVPTCLNLVDSLSNPEIDSQRGVVYVIKCGGCRHIYIGQCKRACGVRKIDHAGAISREDTKYAVFKHHNATKHTILVSDTTILYKEPSEKIRLQLEAYTISANSERVMNVIKNFPVMKNWKKLFDNLPVNTI